MKLKVSILRLDKIINRPILRLTNERPSLFKIYKNTVLPLRVLLFYLTGGKKGNIVMGKLNFQDMLDDGCKKFSSNQINKHEKDIVGCYILYGIDPIEYFLYKFENKDHDQRRQFLSDRERLFGCVNKMSWKIFDELKQKDSFYYLTSKFFNRDVCIIKTKYDYTSYKDFIKKQPRFFAKPNNGTLGAGAEMIDVSIFKNDEEAFNYLLSKNSIWILEEIIHQDSQMAIWNSSCVNTVRMTSFICSDGRNIILQPFIRTGRKGAIVDNAGSGGIFAVFDAETGIITTDGVDECGNRFKKHPDSNIEYKGWQIPRYKELKDLSEIVHRSLPAYHKYVGFDFALSTKGWLLVEGNWGQFVGQIAEQKGIRYKFEELLGLPEDTCFE